MATKKTPTTPAPLNEPRLPQLFTPRQVALDMNVTGAWRALGSYDLDECNFEKVLDAAELLVKSQMGRKDIGKLRITSNDGEKKVLMYWSAATGWEERHRA